MYSVAIRDNKHRAFDGPRFRARIEEGLSVWALQDQMDFYHASRQLTDGNAEPNDAILVSHAANSAHAAADSNGNGSKENEQGYEALHDGGWNIKKVKRALPTRSVRELVDFAQRFIGGSRYLHDVIHFGAEVGSELQQEKGSELDSMEGRSGSEIGEHVVGKKKKPISASSGTSKSAAKATATSSSTVSPYRPLHYLHDRVAWVCTECDRATKYWAEDIGAMIRRYPILADRHLLIWPSDTVDLTADSTSGVQGTVATDAQPTFDHVKDAQLKIRFAQECQQFFAR